MYKQIGGTSFRLCKICFQATLPFYNDIRFQITRIKEEFTDSQQFNYNINVKKSFLIKAKKLLQANIFYVKSKQLQA